MVSNVKTIDVCVADGRPDTTIILATEYPLLGYTNYGCVVNPESPQEYEILVPVQNVPYVDEGSARGLPLEALYAILKDQLAIEIGTVGEGKKEALTASLGLLNASLDILLGINAVPEHVGEVNA